MYKKMSLFTYIFAVNCHFFPTYSIRICTLKLKSGILYQMNSTFQNTVFNISCCSFNILLLTLLLYPAALFLVTILGLCILTVSGRTLSKILCSHIFDWSAFGPFSCDVHDIQKDIFEGKPPQNLDSK